MTKHLLLFTTALIFSLTAQAQFRYTFKDTTTPYAPLTAATSVNGSIIWLDDDYTVPIPFNWKMDSTLSLNSMALSLSFASFFDQISNSSDVNGFMLMDADIADRGLLTGATTLSPIRHKTTGTSPNRIFKLELSNVGFYTEKDLYGTMDDYFSMQVWIYETQNIVEFHYGPSRITHPADYCNLTAAGPFTGYFKHVDVDNGSTGSMYFLKGNAASPSLDSVKLPSSPTSALNSWPANGKVYRFTPTTRVATLATQSMAARGEIKVYPNPAAEQITIDGAEVGDMVTVFSMLGEQVLSTKINKDRQLISLSSLSAGSYVLKLSNNIGTRFNVRFVKR